jgi:large subunit ribosomal protein L13
MRTVSAKTKDIDRKWWIVDAEDKPLGRVASQIAHVLRGKHRPDFTPHVDNGDFVVVINAEKVRLSGEKAEQKFWHRHSAYPGGLKSTPYRKVLVERPTLPLEKAVRGMLPKNPLGRKMSKKLKVYAGPTHPHAAQNPQALTTKVS